jgi:hypothetical protein
MKIDISIGEAIDKFSILLIKQENILEDAKRLEVLKEIQSLNECNNYIKKYNFFFKILMYINKKIWCLTDLIKNMETSDSNFSIISKEIFLYNDKRFRVKNLFNILLNSTLKEQKSYNKTSCKIILDSEETVYNKISEINYLLIEYDVVFLDNSFFDKIKQLFHNPNIFLDTGDNGLYSHKIVLNDFSIPNDMKEIYDFEHLSYASSGKLGDFLQVLSVINENFFNTGRKGVIYIRNGHTFSNGLENTFKDIYGVIKIQQYIKDFKIYNNEPVDIDLDSWFRNSLLYKTNWYNLFKDQYNIEWGKRKWLSLEEKDDKWKDKVLINVMDYRFSVNIDYQKLFYLHGNNLIFISFNTKEYDFFKNATKLQIEHYCPASFMEACVAINSCKLLVATLSGILTIGHAMHKDRIIGLAGILDDVHNIDFNKIWSNVFYKVY